MSDQEKEERLDRKDLTERQDFRDRQEHREKSAMKERWSYVILAVIMIFCFLVFSVAGIKYINNSNRAWCEIIRISIPATAPVKPSNPVADPTGERRYEGYIALTRLANRFQCN